MTGLIGLTDWNHRMEYSAYLKPRQEAISEDGIEGIIDLANLKNESKTFHVSLSQLKELILGVYCI